MDDNRKSGWIGVEWKNRRRAVDKNERKEVGERCRKGMDKSGTRGLISVQVEIRR